jgi:hypothetical protein
MKKYINGILSIGTLALLFYTLFDLRNQVKQVDVLKKELNKMTVLKDLDDYFSEENQKLNTFE